MLDVFGLSHGWRRTCRWEIDMDDRAMIGDPTGTAGAAVSGRDALHALALRLGDGPEGRALSNLAAWYQRLCADGLYSSSAPTEGVAVLQALDPGAAGWSAELLQRSCWAVMIGEELVACRRRRVGTGTGASPAPAAHRQAS